MQRPPGGNQRGGSRIRRAYSFNKADCDCRLCFYHRKKKGCAMDVCPVLDVRLTCGAASFYEAVYEAFADARHISFQRRLSHLYGRKDDTPMIFQTDQHKQRFEAQKLYLRKPDHHSLAMLYLLTADHTLWFKTRRYFSDRGKVDLQAVHLGDCPLPDKIDTKSTQKSNESPDCSSMLMRHFADSTAGHTPSGITSQWKNADELDYKNPQCTGKLNFVPVCGLHSWSDIPVHI